jgi:hypothetical protein
MMKSSNAAVAFVQKFQQNLRLPARRSARCFKDQRMISGLARHSSPILPQPKNE